MFLEPKFLRVPVKVQVFPGPGFSEFGSRVRVEVLEVALNLMSNNDF